VRESLPASAWRRDKIRAAFHHRERDVTALAFDDQGIRTDMCDDKPMQARRQRNRSLASACRALAASLAAASIVFAVRPCEAADPRLIKIAVFDFELNDRSAGSGIIAPDAIDAENLKKSTEEARRMLSASGRYGIVDTSSVAAEAISAGGIQHCNGCDGPLARKLGADQSMIGIVTRVNRTEYALQIVVRDAETGTVVSNNHTGLRMGANYAWPRGVKWVMERILPTQRVD
jgi:hypothetical protein